MKKCPKCQFENSVDSVFCQHCGARLTGQPQRRSHAHWYWLVVIVLVVIAGFFFVGGRHSSTSGVTHRTNPIVPKQFDAKTADRKTQTAAIIYYASENNMQYWPKLDELNGNKTISISKIDEDHDAGSKATSVNVVNNDANDITMGGGDSSYTFFAQDGDNVYFYHKGGPITTTDADQQKKPLRTVSWSAINGFIKDHHADSKVKKIAKQIKE